VPRDRVPLPREPELRDDFAPVLLREDLAAPPLALFAAPDERVAPVPDDFARVEVDFLAPPLERADVDFFAVPVEPRADPADLRPPLELRELDEPVLPLLESSSADHLPDITRCAASATASAMSEPSLVALETTLVAARSAVSAASRPASRIFLRAAGLALIAAAAAARPAASISLLIAALASLSTVLSLEPDREPEVDAPDPDREDVEREELLRADFAIFYLPPLRQRHFNAVPVP
jgi:hypothetical protein